MLQYSQKQVLRYPILSLLLCSVWNKVDDSIVLAKKSSILLVSKIVHRDDSISWNSASNKVGLVNELGDSGREKCQGDQENALTVTRQVPLILALAERYLAGFLDNLSVEVVIPYLQQNLHWRISLVSFQPLTAFPRSKTYYLQIERWHRISSWPCPLPDRFGHQQRSYGSNGRRRTAIIL